MDPGQNRSQDKGSYQETFKFRNRLEDCYKKMTGSAMSLIAYGGFTYGMKISDDTKSHYNVSMFWQLFSMCIPGAVPQPVISDKTSNAGTIMPHTCT